MCDPDPAIRDHLAHLRLRGLSPRTIYQRNRALVRLTLVLPGPLLTATEDDLDRWQHSLIRYSPRYRSSWITHVRGYYRWTVETARLLPPPGPHRVLVRPKLPRSLPHPISEDDLAVAIANAPERLRGMLVLAAFTGLRAAEIAALRREDVLDRADPPVLIATGKGNKQRAVPLSRYALGALQPLPARGYVFGRRDGQGGPNAAWTVSHLCNRYLHSIGVTESLHSLRHRFGSQAYQLTRDIRLVQELLGHESPLTTAGYAAYSNVRAAEMVERLARPHLAPVTETEMREPA